MSIEQFKTAMAARRLECDEPIVADGKLRRYHLHGDRRESQRAYYVLWPEPFAVGVFGKVGYSRFYWCSRDLDFEDRQGAIRVRWKIFGNDVERALDANTQGGS